MDSTAIMTEGLTLLVMGMGFVFFFLTVLVMVLQTMTFFILKFYPQSAELGPKTNKSVKQTVDDSPHFLAAAAAVHRHRKRRR